MSKIKSCAVDGVVTEMLQELDGDIYEEVALLFKDRYFLLGGFALDHVVSLIPKPNERAVERAVESVVERVVERVRESVVSACKRTCHTHTCLALRERGCRIV